MGIEEEQKCAEYHRQERDRQPLLYCAFICDKPKTAFGITLAGHLSLLLVNFILMFTEYEIFPADFQHFPVRLYGELVAQREYAWKYRNDDPDHIERIVLDNLGPTWDRAYSVDDVRMYFTCWGNDVFTQEVLSAMEDSENEVFYLEDYQSTFCQFDENQNCIKPKSIIRYFDGTYRHISEIFYDPYFNNITSVLYTAYKHPETAEDFKYFLCKDYKITPKESYCDLTRSSIPMGWPLEGNGTTAENQKMLEEFVLNEVQNAILKAEEDYEATVEICYFSDLLFFSTILAQAIKDMLLAFGSLGFIFGFIWFQTKSLWITGWAVVSIITSFWITNLIYRVVLDYKYIGYFHMISIFIILGIGADDFFVFYNSWRETEFHEYKSDAHRLSDCYRRSASTMFFTSFTTMMAFLVGGFSPILPIGTFGIFTGILIAVNYISVIIFFPTVVYTHHIHFKDRMGLCCTKSNNEVRSVMNSSSKESTGEPANEIEIIEYNNQSASVKHVTRSINDAYPNIRLDHGRLSTFFRGPYVDFITKPVVRWFIISAFLLLLGFMAWSASYLQIDPGEIKMYRANTNYGKAMRYEGSGFIPSGDSFVILHLVWGMEPRDYSYCHKTDYMCSGKQVWNDHFDLNTPPAQFALKDFCSKLKYGLTEEELEQLMIRNNSDGSGLAIDCYMDNLELYLQDEQLRFNDSVDLAYPLKQSNIEQYILQQPNIYELESLPNIFYRYFEIALGNWMNNHYLMLSTQDYITFDELLGENFDDPNTQGVKFHEDLYNISLGYYGTKLRYAAIRVNLSLSTQELSYIVGLPVMNDWEEFFNNELQNMPASLQGAFQQTDISWHWLTIQKTLAENAVFGIVVGLIIALPVLILATQNLIVGMFATLNICMVTTCVLGVIPLAGWKVDVMISMNLCIVVGLSIDYIVHLAEAYHLSPHTSREMRVRDGLGHLGTSVLAGAMTTIGAAFFMLFAKIQFFLQFGTFLLCTIGFSLMFSMVFFSTVMAFCGPQGNTGSILPPLKWMKNRIIGKSKNDKDCTACEGKGFIASDKSEEQSLDPDTASDTTEESSDKSESISVEGACAMIEKPNFQSEFQDKDIELSTSYL